MFMVSWLDGLIIPNLHICHSMPETISTKSPFHCKGHSFKIIVVWFIIDNVKIYYKCGRSMSQISLLALEPSSHWKGRNKAKLVHKTQITHHPIVWFIFTHMYIQRMDSGYSKYWPIFTSSRLWRLLANNICSPSLFQQPIVFPESWVFLILV